MLNECVYQVVVVVVSVRFSVRLVIINVMYTWLCKFSMKAFTVKGFLKEFLCALRADPPEPVLAWYLHAGTVGGQNSVALGTPRPYPLQQGERGEKKAEDEEEKQKREKLQMENWEEMEMNVGIFFFGRGRFGKRDKGGHGDATEEIRKRNCRAEQSRNEKTVSEGRAKTKKKKRKLRCKADNNKIRLRYNGLENELNKFDIILDSIKN